MESPFAEVGIVLWSTCPSNLSQSKCSGINHVFEMFGSWDVFCPCITLQSLYVCLSFWCLTAVGKRLITVCFLKRYVATLCPWLCHRSVLIVVKITKGTGSHYNWVTLLCGFETCFESSPRHDSGIWCELSFHNFIPSHEFSAMTVKELLYLLREMTL